MRVTAQVIHSINLGLSLNAAAFSRRVGSAAEKPGIIKVIPNGTGITTPAGNGGAQGNIVRITRITRTITGRLNKITKSNRFKSRHYDVEN